MKRFLLSLVAIVITSLCFAQDIIVQKNGSTIQAKVLKVSQSEVEYKKFSNQNGPTYTISTKDLQCINYENGTKDTFVSANYNPSIVTNETATQFSNDKQLMSLYVQNSKKTQKAKTQRLIGYIGGGLLVAGGIVLALAVDELDKSDIQGNSKKSSGVAVAGGVAMMAVGVIGGTWLVLNATHKLKQSESYVSAFPIFKSDLNIGKNDRLMVGVDLLKDNTNKNQTLGLGVSYNF